MMRNMLFNIIFKDTVIILTLKHFPVIRHKLVNNTYPMAMVKLFNTNSVIRAVNSQFSGRTPEKQTYTWIS